MSDDSDYTFKPNPPDPPPHKLDIDDIIGQCIANGMSEAETLQECWDKNAKHVTAEQVAAGYRSVEEMIRVAAEGHAESKRQEEQQKESAGKSEPSA